MSSELVQIEALHQSTEQVMSCPVFYSEAFIKGKKQPGGLESARGIQVHHTGSEYASWCAKKGVAQDLEAFDRFALGAGPTASKILIGMRDSYLVDYKHLLATEVTMRLDENLNPTDTEGSLEGIAGDSGLPVAYEGILDALYVYREEAKINIDDLKTHPQPFEPKDTLQGPMYAVFCFRHFPWAQAIRFRLIFVRYNNLSREVIYTRQDLPYLIEMVKAARARQKMLHKKYAAGEELEAVPGNHCVYCPLLRDKSCPVAAYNDQMQLTPEEWLKWDLWNSAFSKVNRARMKARVQATGRPVVLKDYNGKAYTYGPVESKSFVFPLFYKTEKSVATKCQSCGAKFEYVPEEGLCPQCKKGIVRLLMPIVDHIESYLFATPGDTEFAGKLTLSSTTINKYLSTKGRAMLDQAVSDAADETTNAPYKQSKPLDSVPDDFGDDDEWGEGGGF